MEKDKFVRENGQIAAATVALNGNAIYDTASHCQTCYTSMILFISAIKLKSNIANE